ncbi:oligosaccharide flippase family protein [Arenibaculum sp.]|uniref:oligosaccharide flippase family protein n=1 Tax=Arenibaculum sp. TaxID=2865862 RepID=UPI002E127530|nr:oligosaccharide flippase family protein [Arenibaculum sp.]
MTLSPKLLARAPFLRNVAVLASGTAVAQVLTILAYPILMRLFSPAQFGLFALFGAIVMTVTVVAGLRYELAIVIARTETEAANLLALAMTMTLVMAAASGLAFALGGDALMAAFGTERLGWLLALLPVSIFAFGSYSVLSFWATRQQYYSRLSVSNVCRSVGVAAAQIGLGLARTGAAGLIVGQILGQLFAVGTLLGQILKRDWRRIRPQLSWREMRRAAWVHREFPIYNAPAGLLNSTTITVPSILLATLFGAGVAGLYWFAYRLLEMPMTLLGDATRRVFYQRATELSHSNRELGDLFVRTSGALGLLAAVPSAVLLVAGPWLFEIVFGAAWREAGAYMQWLVVWWFLRFASLPATMLVPLLGLQRVFLVLEVVTLVPRLLVFPVAAVYADAYAAIAAYSLVGVAFHAVAMLVVWRSVRLNDARLRGAQPAPA